MKINKLTDIKKSKVVMEGAVNAFKQIPISSSDGSPAYSFRVFTVEPGGHTPFHNHNYEHLNYIIEGEGLLKNEHGEEHNLEQGDFAIVEPNEKHQYMNKSKDKDFVMICAVPKEFE
ncbi:MAG: cupin domain-containing protein [Bacteroidetes bacterium]|nr:cupin domain-containing protein [Bacteroidota bacterium]